MLTVLKIRKFFELNSIWKYGYTIVLLMEPIIQNKNEAILPQFALPAPALPVSLSNLRTSHYSVDVELPFAVRASL